MTSPGWAELDKVLARHPSWGRRRSPQHRREQHRPSGPLSQLTWTTGGTRWSLTLDHQAYQLWRGPTPVDGQLWSETRTPVLRLPANDLHRALGQRLVQLGEQMDTAPGPLPLLASTSHRSERDSPAKTAQAAADALTAERAQLEREAVGLERERAVAVPGTRSYDRITTQLADSDARLDELDGQIEAAQTAVSQALDVAPDPDDGRFDPDHGLTVDANPLLVVGGALLRLADADDRLGSPTLATALAWLLDDGAGLRITAGQGRHVQVGVKVRLPAEEGLPATLDAGALELSSSSSGPRGTPVGVSTLHDEAALRVLSEQAHQAFLDRTRWGLKFLVEQLRDWLQQRGVTTGACNALIDAALHHERWPAPPVIYSYLTAPAGHGREAAAATASKLGCTAALADTLIDTYIRSGGWPKRATGLIRTPLTEHRRFVALLDAQPGATANRHVIANELGIGKRDLHQIISGADLLGIPLVDYDHETVTLPRCQRSGCRQGTTTAIVAVPETLLAPTPRVLVCRGCRRPSGDYWNHRPLTELHVRLWDADDTMVNIATGSHVIEALPLPSSWTQLQHRLSVAETARRLDIHRSSVNKLIRQGILPARSAQNDRGGHIVLEDDLADSNVIRAAKELRRTKRSPQLLTCRSCGTNWTRTPQPGRPPSRCQNCARRHDPHRAPATRDHR